MEDRLDHLPEPKRQELARVASIIRDGCPGVGLVILFGSYARGDWREEADLAPGRRSGHASDYDILAVTDDGEECDAGTWLAVAQACDESRLSAPVRIIHHERSYLNRQLTKGQFFYSEIVAEGRVLFRRDGFDVAEPGAPDAEARLKVAEEGFAHWFEKARRFYDTHRYHLDQGWRAEATFDLNQAAEAAYKGTLLVFTAYIPNEHYLTLLGHLAEEVAPGLVGIFARDSDFAQDAFALLDYAYIGARYDPQYQVDPPTVSYLAERVVRLLEIAEATSREKIASLRGGNR